MKVELEITRVRTVEIHESATIEVVVPKAVVEDDDFLDWFQDKYEDDPAFAKTIDEVMEENDSTTEIDVESVYRTDE